MNKILKLLSISLIFYLIYKSCKSKKYENMICDLDRPKYNYFFKNYLHLLDNYNFKNKQLSILKGIFNINPKKSKSVKDNKQINSILKNNNVSSKKYLISAINDILNSNRIWDNIHNYVIDGKTTLSNLRHIWLLDKLFTDLRCKGQDSEIVNNLRIKLVGSPLRLCNKDKLLRICSEVSNKPNIKKITEDILNQEEQDFIDENINDEYMDLKKFNFGSIKENVENFGLGYLDSDLNDILKLLFDKFEEKLGREIDTKNRDDLRNLVLLYIPELKNLINRDAMTPDDDEDKVDIKKEKLLNQKMFYLLKHQYKIISIYNLINSMVESEKDKELAYKCCSDINSDGKCYDFNLGTYSLPIIYGFNKYGYVKDSKCTPENQKNIFDEQELTLEQILNKDKNWESIDLKIKDKFFENFSNLINYFLDGKPESFRNKKISYLIGKLNKNNQNIYKIIPSSLDLTKNLIQNKKIPVNYMIESIQMSDNIDTLYILANKYGLEDFKFEVFEDDISKVKFSMMKFIEIKALLLKYKCNPLRINDTLSKMLVLKSSNKKYYDILKEGGILIRYHNNVVEEFSKILSEINSIEANKIDLNSKPIEIIIYKEKVFPLSKDLDLCQSYKRILSRIRDRRAISNKEFLDYKEKIKTFCEKKPFEIKSKPILYNDQEQRTIEVKKYKKKDKFEKDVDIFYRIDDEGQKNIYNLKDSILSETNFILDEDNIINKDSRESKQNVPIFGLSEGNDGSLIEEESIFSAIDDISKESNRLEKLIYNVHGFK